MHFVVSCINCREGHRKCDRLLPICSLCQQRNISCVYQPPRKRRRKLDPNSVEEEWETSIVQYSTSNNDETSANHDFISTPTNSSSSFTSSHLSKQISIPESNSIDKTTIQIYIQRMQSLDKRSIALATLIQQSLSFLDQFHSFKTILETPLPLQQIQSLSRQYKIHFAFVQSIQAITYRQAESISNHPISEEEEQQAVERVNACFHSAIGTVMSDPNIYLDSPNNVLLAWVWASLATAISKNVDASTVAKIKLLLKNVDSFLETNVNKFQSTTKPLLFATAAKNASDSIAKNEGHIPILENMRNTLQLLNRTAIDEDFNNSSILENLMDFSKIIHFLVDIFHGMDTPYSIINNIIHLIQHLQMKFSILEVSSLSTVQNEELEQTIVTILSLFDSFVETFSHVVASLDFSPAFKFVAMYLGIYELKLRFVEELLLVLSASQHQSLIQNLNKVPRIIANQMLLVLKMNETHILRSSHLNVRRCILKMIKIHMEQQEVELETLQFEMNILRAIQHSYMASESINVMMDTLRECILCRETQLQSSALEVGEKELSSQPQDDLSSFFSFEE